MSSVQDHKHDSTSQDHGAEEGSTSGMPKPPSASDHDSQHENKAVSEDSKQSDEGPHKGSIKIKADD